jgi:hypothetical protein
MDLIAKRNKKADKAKRNQDLHGKFSKKAVRQAEALVSARVSGPTEAYAKVGGPTEARKKRD